MPHASGGGSHSGGSHSSSGRSYSSHSSGYSSSHSSYSSSTGRSYSGRSRSYERTERQPSWNKPLVSSKPFYNAKRYVYYRNNKPQYVYSNHETLKRERKPMVLIGWLVFISILALGYKLTLFEPDPLALDYDTRIVVEDQLGVIDGKRELVRALEDFRDKTGVTPAVFTVSNESWQAHYGALVNDAFDLYVNHFEDERHWLIVYSQPLQPDSDFVDWYWEGMQGDETDAIITKTVANDFGERLQKYLTASTRYTVGEAFTRAFDETTPGMLQEMQGTPEDIHNAGITLAVLMLIALWHSGMLRFKRRRPKEVPADALPVERHAKEITCEYCSGVYLVTRDKCPFCGAARTQRAEQ